MSISWDAIRPGLLALFGDLSELQTLWVDKRRPYIDPRAQAVTLLRVRQTEALGVDDRRYSDLAVASPLPTLEEQTTGHRRTSLDVRVEAFRHDDDRFAFNAIEMVRTRLSFRSSLDRLRAVNVSLVRASQAIDLPNIVQDDRITSAAVLDLILNVGICVADSANPVQTIETVDNPFDNLSTVFNPPC